MGTPRRILVDLTWILRHTSKTKVRHILTPFPRTFFDVISMIEKSTLLPRTLFDVISMVKKSTLSPRTLFDIISMVDIYALFLLTFFNIILMGKNSTSFLVSFKLMRTFEEVFPVFVTVNS